MAEEPPVNVGVYGNETGTGMVIRQSDLSAWTRCNLQKHYYDNARHIPGAPKGKALSRTVWGTVLHHVLQTMEQMYYEKREDALPVALATFEHYWRPENLDEVAEQIDEWLPRETYGGLRDKGRIIVAQYFELMKADGSTLLALEYPFAVPIEAEGRVHTLTGTIDRLSLRLKYGRPYISVDDYKSGKQPRFLRYAVQGTAYCYASTQREFWLPPDVPGLTGFDPGTVAALEEIFSKRGSRLHEGSPEPTKKSKDLDADPLAPRGFKWINLPENKHVDGGFRVALDYTRLKMSVAAYVKANEAQIFMLTLSGDACVYCPFRDICGGVGLADEDAGRP